MTYVYDSNDHGLGLLPGKTDIRDYKFACCSNEENYPISYERKCVRVKNQGSIPSCAAHAGSEIVEMFNLEQSGTYTRMSTEFIYGNRPEGTYQGDGMYLRDVCNTLVKKGDLTYEELPGNSNVKMAIRSVENLPLYLSSSAYKNRVSTYFMVSTENEMKHTLMTYGPLLVSMNIYKVYSLDDNYIYTPDYSFEVTGCHAVVIYGWNEHGWLVQNSWGTSWGDNGRFVIPFDFKFNEVFGFTDEIYEDDFKRPYKTFIGKIFAVVANYIINFFRRCKK